MPAKRSARSVPKGRCGFNRQDLILRFWEVIPSTVAALNRVLARVLRVARAMECARGNLDKVEIALREALNNAITHGSGGDPKKKVAICCLCAEDKGMLLVVENFGPAFDPSKIPDPTKAENVFSLHGRGIFLMRQMMDEVTYRKGGRQVIMKKAARPRHRR